MTDIELLLECQDRTPTLPAVVPNHITLERLSMNMNSKTYHNKTVPLEILRILAKDDDEEVRHMVAMKRKLDADLFKQLACDPSEFVRQRIAYNAGTPCDVLRALTQDNSPIVSEAARNRLGHLKARAALASAAHCQRLSPPELL